MTEDGRPHWTRRQFGRAALAVGAAASLPAWLAAGKRRLPALPATPKVTGQDSLRAHAAVRGLLFGAAVNPALLDVEGIAAGTGTTDGYTLMFATQAGILVAENAMKWAGLRPSPETFDFSQADRMMRFADLVGQRARGHNLCWHEALPAWFKATATPENARQLLTQHIEGVCQHFRGRLQSWDVVNEAVAPADGRPDGLRQSPWLELIGPDYIELAFQTAAQSDPLAKLVYNDYGIELDTPEQIVKRGQVLLLLRRMKARGIPIHAVGVQSHLQASGPQPGEGLRNFIRDAASLGLEVYVTEMDVNTRGVEGGPEAQDAAVAAVYRDYLGMVLAEPNVPLALTWGLSSANSWLNKSNQPWAKRPDGARQRPLPFDDDLEPAPAFFALRTAIDAAHVSLQPPEEAVPAPGADPAGNPAADPGSLYKPFAVPGSPTQTPANPGPGH
jgi:endo-1,4-beta-xylanase